MENQNEKTESPHWSTTTKAIVAIAILAILAAVISRFSNILGPLLIAFFLAYLFYPVVEFLNKKARIAWKLGAGILYLLILAAVIGSITWGGFALVEQVQNLIKFLQTEINNLPDLLNQLANLSISFGPFEYNFNQLDLTSLGNQLLGIIQPVLANLGSFVASLATGAASTIGWFLFSLLISFFLVFESGGMQSKFIHVHIPGYDYDIQRFGEELNRIWNAFLRGQLIIFLITVAFYSILLGGLGVNFYVGLAVVAGLARFVPYVGPVIAWTTYGLVAVFMGENIFGVTPITYALIVVGAAWITDVIMDNLVVPRLMGEALKVHPAAVMVSAIIFADLFGLIGVVLAAPVFATLKLILDYIFSKFLNRDPWENIKTYPQAPPTSEVIKGFFTRSKERIAKIYSWVKSRWIKFISWVKNLVQKE